MTIGICELASKTLHYHAEYKADLFAAKKVNDAQVMKRVFDCISHYDDPFKTFSGMFKTWGLSDDDLKLLRRDVEAIDRDPFLHHPTIAQRRRTIEEFYSAQS